MTARLLAASLAAAALTGTAAGAVVAVAPAAPARTAAVEVTRTGAGKVRLGRTYRRLRDAKAIWRIRPGCEPAGPSSRSAALRRPLRGSVEFTQTSPRRAAFITIRAGARARGIGVGSTLKALRKAFPKARIDRRTEEIFRFTTVHIPRRGGGRFDFAVSLATKRVTEIGIPGLFLCD